MVVSDPNSASGRASAEERRGRPSMFRGPERMLLRQARPYLWSTAAVGLAAAVGLGLTFLVRLPNVSMVFLPAILFSAAHFGIWPGLGAVVPGLQLLLYRATPYPGGHRASRGVGSPRPPGCGRPDLDHRRSRAG